ncbi:hypothetical protein C8R47DRAFT_226951 [Mycena vitilis]|nr:hypothetical protein C8R47DRAFT_226951 [Mycena vitilis]
MSRAFPSTSCSPHTWPHEAARAKSCAPRVRIGDATGVWGTLPTPDPLVASAPDSRTLAVRKGAVPPPAVIPMRLAELICGFRASVARAYLRHRCVTALASTVSSTVVCFLLSISRPALSPRVSAVRLMIWTQSFVALPSGSSSVFIISVVIRSDERLSFYIALQSHCEGACTKENTIHLLCVTPLRTSRHLSEHLNFF